MTRPALPLVFASLLLLALAAPASHLTGQVGAALPLPECMDGLDNDGDETDDWPDDDSCSGATDASESDCVFKVVRSSVYTAHLTLVDHVAVGRYSCSDGAALLSYAGGCADGPTWKEVGGCDGWSDGFSSYTLGAYACMSLCTFNGTSFDVAAMVSVHNDYGPECDWWATENVEAYVVHTCRQELVATART